MSRLPQALRRRPVRYQVVSEQWYAFWSACAALGLVLFIILLIGFQ